MHKPGFENHNMKKCLLLLCALMPLLVGCVGMDNAPQRSAHDSSELLASSEEVAKTIAMDEMLKDNKDVEQYEVSVKEEIDRWCIHFRLKDKFTKGGGREYVISKNTGRTIEKKLSQ